MNLFYTPPEQVQEKTLNLSGDEARHAVKVLRFKVGDAIFVTDGAGSRYEGRIEVAGKNKLQVSILHKHSTPKPAELVLVLGLLKNRQRLEFAIEKAVELGCIKIILFKSDHSERGKVNLERLQAIAVSAMKQSLRNYLPDVQLRDSLGDAIKGFNDHTLITAHEKQKKEAPTFFELNKNHLALVGPEGGFSDDEIRLMEKSKGRTISLGDYRLRTETAVVALLSRFY
ncbi:MAG: RsmE family RNA methyltransferase [Balneolales bacterium]